MHLHTAVCFLRGFAPLLAHAQEHALEVTNTQTVDMKAITISSTTLSTLQTPVTQASNPIPSSISTDTAAINIALANNDDDSFEPVSGFIKTCIAWQVWDANNHMWANCRGRGRKGKLFWSRIGLDHMLGNVGGRLVYQKNGYFSSSCVSCHRRQDTQSYFQCECADTKGELKLTSIDLNSYLGNRDGHLCSEYECGVREGPPPGGERA